MPVAWVDLNSPSNGSGNTEIDPRNVIRWETGYINFIKGTTSRLTFSGTNVKNVALLPWPGASHDVEALFIDVPTFLPGVTKRVQVNNGMWRIDGSSGSGALLTLNSNGVENIWVSGVQMDSLTAAAAGENAIVLGVTGSTGRKGFKLSCSRIANIIGIADGVAVSGGAGVVARANADLDISWTQFENVMGDCIYSTLASNSPYGAGSYYKVYYCDFIEPGTRYTDNTYYDSDCAQVSIDTNSPQPNTSYFIYGNHVRKHSPHKQGFLVGGNGAGIVAHNLFKGFNQGAATIFFNSVLQPSIAYANTFIDVPIRTLRVEAGLGETVAIGPNGIVRVDRNRFIGNCEYVMRLPRTGTGGNNPSNLLQAGSKVQIWRNYAGTDCTFSEAFLSIQAHNISEIANTFTLDVRENIMLNTGQTFIRGESDLATQHGQAIFQYGKNYVAPGTKYLYGSNEYTDAGAWATATNTSTQIEEMTSSEALLNQYGQPLADSPLLSGSTLDDLQADFFGNRRAGGSLGGPIGLSLTQGM